MRMGNKTTDNPHDTRLKELFGNKEAFLSFLRDCVKAAWVEDIDPNSLKPIPKSFVLQDFRKKEADILYEAKLKSGGETIFFYVLLENQSRVDYRMAYRLLLYIVEILRDWYNHADEKERQRKNFKFPAVVPLVFHTGRGKWTAATSLREMFSGHRRFGDSLLNFKYTVVDAKSYDEESVKGFESKLLKIMMLIEHSQDFAEVAKTAKRHQREIRGLNDEEKRILGVALDILSELYAVDKKPDLKEILYEKNAGRVDGMFADVIANGKKLVKKSRAEGRAEGRVEGEKSKAIKMAAKMLSKNKPIDEIVEFTELTIEEIEELKNKM